MSKSKVSSFISSKINIIKIKLTEILEIDDLIFTTNVFDTGGLFLVSYNKKLAIRLIDKSKGPNNKFNKECRERGYIGYDFDLKNQYTKLIDLIKAGPKLNKNKQAVLEGFARKLNDSVPKSEVWFRKKFSRESVYQRLKLEFNKPFKDYIYDLFSREYQIAIEVDGSYHDRPEQILKDKKKDSATNKNGIVIYRIKAYDEVSYSEFLKAIKIRINDLDSKRKIKREKEGVRPALPAVILRKEGFIRSKI